MLSLINRQCARYKCCIYFRNLNELYLLMNILIATYEGTCATNIIANNPSPERSQFNRNSSFSVKHGKAPSHTSESSASN